MKAKKTKQAEKAKQDELIPTPLKDWTCESAIREREPNAATRVEVKTTVTQIRYRGKVVATLEGPTSRKSAEAICLEWNEKGYDASYARKAFADYGDSARRNRMVQHYQGFVGPGFDEESRPGQENHTKPDRTAMT